MLYLIVAVVSYLLGSVNSAVLISRYAFRADVRELGSGNAGATNMARVYGMKPGLIVLACDALKMGASAWVGSLLCGELGFAVSCVACNLGHCHPVFFGFRGGKGVSVGVMVALLLDWRLFLIGLALFFLLYFVKKTVSLSSISMAASLPVSALLLGLSAPRCLAALATAIIILFEHRSNIGRLLRGEEAPFRPKK